MSARPGWLYSAVLVAATNLLPLAGWWWNRSGEPEAAVDLSEHEAYLVRGGEDDSSIRLHLSLADSWRTGQDSTDLVALGFDADLLTTGQEMPLPPRRPSRRPAWILLHVGDTPRVTDSSGPQSSLKLVAIGTGPGELYRRSGDRGSHIVMRGAVRLGRVPVPPDSAGMPVELETWSATVDLLSPGSLHVPKSLVPLLDRLAPSDRPGGAPRYLVRVSMGRLHLPRVTGVFPAP